MQEVGAERDVRLQERYKERAREMALPALERLFAIATGDSAPQHAIAAAKALIEFAFGRAAQERVDDSAQSLELLDTMLASVLPEDSPL